jgi:hypothetical protein
MWDAVRGGGQGSRAAMVVGHIVQLDEDPRTWAEFLRKAAIGSVKAADWLSSADMAVAERLGGRRLVDEAQLSEYEDVMGGPGLAAVR